MIKIATVNQKTNSPNSDRKMKHSNNDSKST